MKIDTSTWKWFVIEDLFDKFETGKGHDTLLDDGKECLYLGAKKSDNGVMRRCAVNESMLQNGNCIVFICNGAGSVGYANYMDKPFIATTDLVLGYADWLNEKTGLFVATVLCKERFKYSFGRKWKTHLRDTKIKLPATLDGKPNWQWMESYIDSLHSEPLTTQNDMHVVSLDTGTWKTFGYTEVFKVCKGFYNKKPEPPGEGTIPFLSATSENNGVTEYYTLEEIANATRTGNGSNDPLSRKLFPGHAVCVTNNGSVGFAYYQAKRFTCSHDVNPLYRLDGEFTEATGLFVASVIMKDRYRWAYGRKWRPERMVHSTIDLPATPDGKPDWQWMENYIKSLPYGDRFR